LFDSIDSFGKGKMEEVVGTNRPKDTPFRQQRLVSFVFLDW
jgi:hypothetical protein